MIIDGEKALDKTQYPFMMKTALGIEENLIKSICEKLTASNILHDEQPEVFPVRSGTRQGTLPTSAQHCTGWRF